MSIQVEGGKTSSRGVPNLSVQHSSPTFHQGLSPWNQLGFSFCNHAQEPTAFTLEVPKSEIQVLP